MTSADAAKNQALVTYLQRLQELRTQEPEKKSFLEHLEGLLLRQRRNVPFRRENSNFVAALHAEHETRLRELRKHVPEARVERMLGAPVLLTPAGRVFAIMGGTHDLMLYLPEQERWGRAYPEIGEHWRRWYAWPRLFEERDSYEQQLASILRLSYSTAMSADVVA